MTPWHTYKKSKYLYNAINIYNHRAKKGRKINLNPLSSFEMTNLNTIFDEIKNMYFRINRVLDGLIEIVSEDRKDEVIVK